MAMGCLTAVWLVVGAGVLVGVDTAVGGGGVLGQS